MDKPEPKWIVLHRGPRGRIYLSVLTEHKMRDFASILNDTARIYEIAAGMTAEEWLKKEDKLRDHPR